MKILHLSFSASGGAGRVARRLANSQLELGSDSSFRFRLKTSLWTEPLSEPLISTLAAADEYFLRNKTEPTLFSYFRDSAARRFSDFENADVINFHWTPGLVDSQNMGEVIRNNPKQLFVWTLHDMFAFTAGCHHAHDCRLYLSDCNKCPQARNALRPAIAKRFQEKISHFSNAANLAIVAPTDWIFEAAKSSQVLGNRSIRVIPNPIDQHFQTRIDIKAARRILQLPEHSLISIVVAEDLSDPNKGVQMYVDKFLKNKNRAPERVLILVGKNGSSIRSDKTRTFLAGVASAADVSVFMSAADFLAVPSKAETSPTVISEAGCLGVPTIGLASNRGASDMILRLGYGDIVNSWDQLEGSLSKLRTTRLHFSRELSNIASKLYSPNSVGKAYLKFYKEELAKL